MAAFPTKPVNLLGSFVRNLLTELSTLVYTLPSNAFTTEDSRMVSKYKHYITDVRDVLSILLKTDFAVPSNRNRSKSRKTKNRYLTPQLNEASFNNLGLRIPSNASEATKTSAGILRTLSQVLRVCSVAFVFVIAHSFPSFTLICYPSLHSQSHWKMRTSTEAMMASE